ncbi:hypothetical protein BWQ96_08185 [Gracilariopsis chorda]|uniref:BZIP domain-containing protein n=1 Tax=Gracilariopsis chorda TaxID=448386 RepID=A0A2V3IJ44_9FLOR|nr:hypothetical protein BWQ96_08185 [Gracilariopsis chorda]|eukprot:PXF42079.1 hypothetical protein BWQ96_08185 [Gracilariopsis chorda]
MPAIDTPTVAASAAAASAVASVALSAQPWLPTPSPPIRLTPRFSPTFGQLQSPGVSAEIAANPGDPNAPSQSLSDLFRCTEYPFTSAAPRAIHVPQPPTRPVQPKQDVSFVQSQPVATNPPIASSAALTAAFRPVQNPPHQSVFSQAPHSFPLGAADNAPTLPPRPAITSAATATAPAIAPVSDLTKAALTVGGQRAVLGSGIMSNAVQEAQVRARMKAESFAKARKRKRAEHPTDAEKAVEKISEDDARLTAEQLKRKRYERRLALNRESAAVSRVRRREYVKLLEEQLVNAEKERVRLATELEDMQKQHNKLKDHLRNLERAV